MSIPEYIGATGLLVFALMVWRWKPRGHEAIMKCLFLALAVGFWIWPVAVIAALIPRRQRSETHLDESAPDAPPEFVHTREWRQLTMWVALAVAVYVGCWFAIPVLAIVLTPFVFALAIGWVGERYFSDLRGGG